MDRPIVYEQHCHTPLCRHADGMPEAYAQQAERRGLAGIVVTCHNPMPEDYAHAGRMRASEMGEYLSMVENARQRFAGRVDVRVGLECDYFPGYERHVEHQLATYHFHHVLGSVHPHLKVWRQRFEIDGDPIATQTHYFDQLADAAETGLFDTLSHPDLVKNMTAEAWDPGAIHDVLERTLERIARTGVAMELNTSGLHKQISEMNPGDAMLKMMAARKIPVVVGADAHVPQRVAANFEDAYDLLLKAGYTHCAYFVDRTRHDIPIEAARDSLNALATADTA